MSKSATGRIENVGQDLASGQTVIYCIGTSAEIAGAKFSMRIPEGKYAYYNVEIARSLRGKAVVFEFLSLSDIRVPRSITFKAVLE